MKRYDLEFVNEYSDSMKMVESEDGDWVDAEEALKEIARWKKECEILNKEYCELNRLYLNVMGGG